jgi:hypothetical protein
MSFISVSPGEIFAASKSLYRIWQETKGAQERYCKAREFADCAQVSLGTLRDARHALGIANDELLPYIGRIEKAHDDLNSYLGRFEVHFAQSATIRGPTQLTQKFRWAFDQLDDKVESLQSTLTAALTMCSLALVPHMRYGQPASVYRQKLILSSLQISSTRQQVLGQTINASETIALASSRIPKDAQVVHAVTQPCWQRPKGCYCLCHVSNERTWHSTLLGTVGLASFFVRCNRGDCDTRQYAAYARFALSRFGMPLAIRIATELKVFGGVIPILYPTIEVQRVCDFASPGFKVLAELTDSSLGIDYSLDEDKVTELWEIAKERKVVELKRLFASGEASPLDIDPDGHTWLEVPLHATICFVRIVLIPCRNFFDVLGQYV